MLALLNSSDAKGIQNSDLGTFSSFLRASMMQGKQLYTPLTLKNQNLNRPPDSQGDAIFLESTVLDLVRDYY